MKINEGTLDRALRVSIGMIGLALVVVGPKSAWGFLGAVPLMTGLAGNCPLYSLLGISTCASKAVR